MIFQLQKQIVRISVIPIFLFVFLTQGLTGESPPENQTSPEVIQSLVHMLLHDPTPWGRVNGAMALGAFRDRSSVQFLIQSLLQDRERNVRLAVVQTLCLILGPQFGHNLIQLGQPDENHNGERELSVLLNSLISEEVIQELIRTVRSEPTIRRHAAFALKQSEGRECLSFLNRAALQDEDPLIRFHSWNTIGELGRLNDIPVLIEALRRHEEDHIIVALAIGQIGRRDPSVISYVAPLLAPHEAHSVQMTGAFILNYIWGQTRSLEALPQLDQWESRTREVWDTDDSNLAWHLKELVAQTISQRWERLASEEKGNLEEEIVRFFSGQDRTRTLQFFENVPAVELRSRLCQRIIRRTSEEGERDITNTDIQNAQRYLIQFHRQRLTEVMERRKEYAEPTNKYGGALTALGILGLLSTRSVPLDDDLEAERRDDAIRNAWQMLLRQQNSLGIEFDTWFQIYALQAAVALKRSSLEGLEHLDESLLSWTTFLLSRQHSDGGWGYGGCPSTSFTTAAAMLSLQSAAHLNSVHPMERFPSLENRLDRAVTFLQLCIRPDPRAFSYRENFPDSQRGSAGRIVSIQLALHLGATSDEQREGHLDQAINSSLQYLSDLKAHVERPGIHMGDDGLAPYYFYFNLPYLASAIALERGETRESHRQDLLRSLFAFRLRSGLWPQDGYVQDPIYSQSMVLMALSALYQGNDTNSNALALLP